MLPLSARKALDEEARRLLNYTEMYPFATQAQAARQAELHASLDDALCTALAEQGYAEVAAAHATYVAALKQLFETHKSALGFGDRELVVS